MQEYLAELVQQVNNKCLKEEFKYGCKNIAMFRKYNSIPFNKTYTRKVLMLECTVIYIYMLLNILVADSI